MLSACAATLFRMAETETDPPTRFYPGPGGGQLLSVPLTHPVPVHFQREVSVAFRRLGPRLPFRVTVAFDSESVLAVLS